MGKARLGRQERRDLITVLAERDGGSFCRYCGRGLKPWQVTVDHVVPIARRGAKKLLANLVIACHACNQHKRDRTLTEAGMMLRGPSEACRRAAG